MNIFNRFLKRSFDMALSAMGLAVLSPVMLLIAALIKLEDAGPVLYRGERVGKNKRPFRMLKFRTMVVNAEKLGASSTSDDDSRITKTGRFLRRCKLDELPQLINVFKGEMSLVGPRPQVKWAVELYSENEKRLLSVRPGITDYASIRFRNEGEILKGSTDPDRDYLEKIAPEKIRLGLLYVDSASIITDMKIILLTLGTLLGLEKEERGLDNEKSHA